MTVKEYLWQIRDLDRMATRAMATYDRLIRDVSALRSQRYDSDKVQSSASGAGFESQIDRIVDAQREAQAAWNKLIDERKKIISQINQMSEPYSSILFKRYAEYKDFMTIADELNYSYQWILELHGTALIKFKRRFLDKT